MIQDLADIINRVHNADCLDFLRDMPDGCVDCVVTSPPYYGLRDYGVDGQIGLEPTIAEYIGRLVEVFGECKRVLKKTGTVWINISDSYSGSGKGAWDNKEVQKEVYVPTKAPLQAKKLPPKSLCQIPERLSLALTDDLGLIKRNTVIWYKRNCMPSSVSDRFTVDFEYLYFFTKSKNYWFEQQFEPMDSMSIERMKYGWDGNKTRNYPGGSHNNFHKYFGGKSKEEIERITQLGRNKRTVWDVPTESFSEAHFAVFPRALVYTPIKAGCPDAICNRCGKAREKIYAEKEGAKYDEDGKPEGRNRSKMKWNNSHPTKNPRFWSNPTVTGRTDCGCNAGFHSGIVLDPFAGSGTTCLEAKEQGKNYIGIELNPEYLQIAEKRLRQEVLPLGRVREQP